MKKAENYIDNVQFFTLCNRCKCCCISMNFFAEKKTKKICNFRFRFLIFLYARMNYVALMLQAKDCPRFSLLFCTISFSAEKEK